MTETHPAIRFIEVGRGYGVTRVPVVNFGNIGRSTMLHIIGPEIPKKAICGKGPVSELYQAIDPKAIRVAGANVCYRCQLALGHVPMPELVKNVKEDADG